MTQKPNTWPNKPSDVELPEIDITKEYTVRDGRPAKVFMTNGGGDFPVIGAYLTNMDYWVSCAWTKHGLYRPQYAGTSEIDLIPAKKKGELWLNVFPNNTTNTFGTRKAADKMYNGKYCGKRIACVRVKWEEGQFDD